MKPRKPTSLPKHKQDFPVDYIKMIKDVVAKNFKKFVKDKNVKVDGHIYMQEITVRIGFENKNGIKQVNFQASVDHDTKRKDTLDRISLAIDALGSMVSQYVEAEEDIELPTEWTEFDFEKNKVFLKFSTENTDLEAKANALLSDEEDDE